MITANDANNITSKCDTWNVVERQLLYVNGWIESSAILGKSKFNWIIPDDFTKKETNYILDSLRKRGFEAVRGEGVQLYTILW